MADELLAFLAERKIPTLDARTLFAGRSQRFYWLEDHHIDATAQLEIGRALAPVVESVAAEKLR